MVTHGSVGVLVRYLRERGLDAQGFVTEYGDEDEVSAPEVQPAESSEATA
jgi:putative mRNA 3-end processing factor